MRKASGFSRGWKAGFLRLQSSEYGASGELRVELLWCVAGLRLCLRTPHPRNDDVAVSGGAAALPANSHTDHIIIQTCHGSVFRGLRSYLRIPTLTMSSLRQNVP